MKTAQNGSFKSEHLRDATRVSSRKTGENAFVVQANVNIASTAEFIIHAACDADAKKLAEHVLDEAIFKVAALSDSQPDLAVSIPEGCIDCQVVEVELSQPGVLLDLEGARSSVESKMGALALTEIERLARSSRFDDEVSANTQSAIINRLSEGLYELWLSYAKDQTEQPGMANPTIDWAVKRERAKDDRRGGSSRSRRSHRRSVRHDG